MTTDVKNKVFSRIRIKKSCYLKRKLGFKSVKDALIEVNNLLASRDLTLLAREDIQQIASRYHIRSNSEFHEKLKVFYKEYLLFCLEDRFLSNEEVKDLTRLRIVLSLNDAEAMKIHDEAAGEHYKMEVEKAIEDGRLDEDEKHFLKEIQKALKLSDAAAHKIYQNSAHELLSRCMKEALADQRLTAEEEEELEAIKKSLNIGDIHEGSERANYEKYKLFWQIENGRYPVFETDLEISVDEPCHFYAHAEWLEQNIAVKEENAEALRAKIHGSHKWKLEDREMKPALEDIWATLDNGKVYLTGNKILLVGAEGEKQIPLKNIIDFSAYKNGVNIVEKQKCIFIQFRDHIDIFAMILGKAILSN